MSQKSKHELLSLLIFFSSQYIVKKTKLYNKYTKIVDKYVDHISINKGLLKLC